MSYIDSGFDDLMYREKEGTGSAMDSELTEDIASKNIYAISGTSVTGGITSSKDGKMAINWDTGTQTFSDGAYTKILIGFQKGGF